MTMPKELVLVRHGESEANVIHKNAGGVYGPDIVARNHDRPDSLHPLTARGIEQAKKAGAWIREHIGPLAEFDAHMVGPFVRQVETAAYMSGDEDIAWLEMKWLAERDWGDYGRATREEQQEKYARTFAHKKIDPIFARLDGGQSNLDVMGQVRFVYDTLHRQHEDDRVIMVTSGGIMNVVINDLERLWLDEWRWRETDKKYDYDNCTVAQISRTNPFDSDAPLSSRLQWIRISNTVDPGKSPNNGEWMELSPRKARTAAELLRSVQNVERLLGPDGLAK